MTSPTADHGTALTDRVVASVEADPHRLVLGYSPWVGPWLTGAPEPMPADVLAGITFPSGRPLPPSLRRWLAYDTSLLRRFDWFGPEGDFTPRPMGKLADEEFGEPWGSCFAALSDRFDECFLLPGGSDSRRVLATGEPDAHGEYPVFALDVDDIPCIMLMYPGLDVYLADTAGLITLRGEGYSDLADDRTYGPRMREHARHAFGGALHEECLPDEF
ncbi:hypothetical protein ACFWOG_36530 [Kitasatospora sp. NPDC058406]|uniref:hypothetical protein n=1 Tax=Kitasatospora sp. NPDC058406 TaxID=3346483 RepID=UPI003653197E